MGMTDKVKKYGAIAVIFAIGFAIGAYALVSNAGEDSDKLKVAIEEQNAEKNKLKDKKDTLVEEMEKELSSAKTDEEKEAIKEKFDKEISKVDKEIDKIEINISKDEKKYETALKEETKKETQNAPSKNEVKPNTDKKSDSVNKDANKKTETDKKTESNKKADEDKKTNNNQSGNNSSADKKTDSDKKVETNKNESVTPSEKPKTPKKVLVKEAWDEEVDDLDLPIYEYVKYWWIRFDDGRGIVRYYDEAEWYYIAGSDPNACQWGDGDDYEERFLGYEKKIIHHDAIYKEVYE